MTGEKQQAAAQGGCEEKVKLLVGNGLLPSGFVGNFCVHPGVPKEEKRDFITRQTGEADEKPTAAEADEKPTAAEALAARDAAGKGKEAQL